MKHEIPWFIRKFGGVIDEKYAYQKNEKSKYIMLFRDFESITGIHLEGEYTVPKGKLWLAGGYDYNGFGWRASINQKKFKKEHGFEYGEDDVLFYLYLGGIEKALYLCRNKISDKTYYTIMMGVIAAEKKEVQESIKPIEPWWSRVGRTPSLEDLIRDYRYSITHKESLIKECTFYENLINEYMATVKEDKEYTKQVLADRLVEGDAI